MWGLLQLGKCGLQRSGEGDASIHVHKIDLVEEKVNEWCVPACVMAEGQGGNLYDN